MNRQTDAARTIQELANYLVSSGLCASVSLFGSVVGTATSPPRDVDVLMTGKSHFDGDSYVRSIQLLRRRLLDGYRDCGFRTQPGAVGAAVSSFLRRRAGRPFTWRVMYVFGPHKDPPAKRARTELILHVKGPLNQRELELFCEVLPFHAFSILSSAVTCSGSIDAAGLLRGIRLSARELELWIRSLERRVTRYDDHAETARCVRKLRQLADAFSRANQLDAGVMTPHHDRLTDDGSSESLHTSPPASKLEFMHGVAALRSRIF